MSGEDDRPEPDRVDGAPHPRETAQIFGQDAAIASFLSAYNAGRLHHGWLITGPRGVGKATLAWAIARFLLATPEADGAGLFGEAPPEHASLDIPADHPVARQIHARSHGGLASVRRPYDEKAKRLRKEITVEEIRALKSFFGLSATDGGRRVVIVDTADEMTVSAANALLKMLEEPPKDTTLLLISHQPSQLLPTIRSRCRELRLNSLSAEAMGAALAQADVEQPADMAALSELANGSVGEALRLITHEGTALYSALVSLFSQAQPDRQRALKLAELAATRGGEARYDLLITLIETFLARLARGGALGHPPAQEAAKGEAALIARLSPDNTRARAWAALGDEVSARIRHGRAVNLDPAALILDTTFKIAQTAAS